MTELTKYPRTPHLPDSPGLTASERVLSFGAAHFLSHENDFMVSEKMDGGNVTMTYEHFFARSLDSGTQPWDTEAKAIWANVHFRIPRGWRIVGESLQARRSVPYENLPAPFLVFAVFDEDDVSLGWDAVEWVCEDLKLKTVPVLYRGSNYAEALAAGAAVMQREAPAEGFVIRSAGNIHPGNWEQGKIAKWVRANHVQTSDDWRHRDDFATNGIMHG